MADTQVGAISVWDIVVIILYFIIVLAVGLWSSWKSTRGTVGGFFLASRSMHWLLVGASLFASNIGSGHFVGLAGSGAAGGIAVAGFELNAGFVMIALGWIFVPVYLASGVYTMPEYLQLRFGGKRIQMYLAVLALLLYVFTKISADLFAGTIFIDKSLQIDVYWSITLLLLIACLFTVAGGLTAVIWTDAIQVVIMLFGAFILMIISFVKVGGYDEMESRYFTTMPNVNQTQLANTTDACRNNLFPRKDAMSLLRAVDADLPWTGMTFGLTISAVWYWCSDQVIVQRALASKNYSHAKGGCVFAAWLKFLPLFLLVFPGMIARVLFTDEIVCYSPSSCKETCGQASGCTNVAYPLMVVKLMPVGLRGLMLACMLSALMSSLTSIFNSSSTIFTMDIWPMLRPKANDVEKLIVGRLFVVFLVIVSILWIPVIRTFPNSELFNYIQSVTSYLAPPVCAVYCLAILVPRVNEKGAFWGLMMGLLVGMTRFILEIAYGSPSCEEVDTRPLLLTAVHYLHFGILLFVIVAIVTLVVSFITEPDDPEHLRRLTFWSRHDSEPPKKREEKTKAQQTDTVYQVDNLQPIGENNAQTAAKPTWRKCLDLALGLNQPQTQKTAEEIQEQQDKERSLHEEPFWKLFWNIQAVVVVAVTVFFYIFYF